MSGRGVEAEVNGSKVAVGGPVMLGELNFEVPASLAETVEGWKQRGAAVLYVIEDGRVTGAFSVEDEVRPESRQAVDELHRLGVKVAMITGDARQVAEAVAADLDIDQVLSEVLPEDKHAEVGKLQRDGQRVAMVGDGVNDAPALAQADVGIAIGAGTDVAIESAGIVLASDDPRGVVGIRKLSQAGYRKMVQNLAWATGYNVVAIPLAAGAFAWAGLVLAPAAAAVLMSASTVIVAINAQFLRRLELRPE
jgi:Cu2+-exporting ATPase